ncbi:MAG TPA: energy transducer TonB, partial [Planctomycetota bacterium]|nr:energy transducer TonB [Planctomycetota bacterium]
MRSRPIVVSFVLHAAALTALAVHSIPPRAPAPDMHAFLSMEQTEPCPDLDETEPLDVELLEPEPLEVTVEPEAVEEEPEEPPLEFRKTDMLEAVALPEPARIPCMRIPPLRHREPPAAATRAPPPAPPRSAAGAPVVRAAFPRSDGCRPPRYPAAAQRLGHEGRVLLLVRVGADGVPESVEVEESSGHASLDDAAVAAVRAWVFEPAREDDRPVASRVHVPIRFQLRG